MGLMEIINRYKFGKLLKNISINDVDALKGVEFEQFVSNLLAYSGFSTFLTSATGDNGIDVIAKSKRYSIGIQTKLYYNHSVGNKAIQEVYSGKNYYNMHYAIVITNSQFSAQAKDVAIKLKVGLIDRGGLIKMLSGSRKENNNYIKNIISLLQD